MVEQSRRKFLTSASLGAVAVGAALAPGMRSNTVSAAPRAAGRLPTGPLTAYVKDHRTGEIAVQVGEHEVVYRDPDLAARLAHIASRAQAS